MHGRRLHPLLLIMKKSKKTAFAGIFSALVVAVLYIGSIFQTLDLSAAAFGSFIILASLIELGTGWAFGVFAASALLSILLLPYKSPALVFLCFTGFYPIIKQYFHRIKSTVLSYLVRLAVFNVFLTLMIFLAKNVFMLKDEFFGFNAIIYVLSNVVFAVYDFTLERMAIYYIKRLRKVFFGRR